LIIENWELIIRKFIIPFLQKQEKYDTYKYMLFVQNNGILRKIFFNPQVWHNNFLIYNFFSSFTLLLIIWGEIIWALFALKGSAFLSLHYSIYFGVDWLGGPAKFFVFSVFATIVLLSNYILSNIFYENKRILSYFLACAAPLAEIFILISVSLAIYINWTSAAGG